MILGGRETQPGNRDNLTEGVEGFLAILKLGFRWLIVFPKIQIRGVCASSEVVHNWKTITNKAGSSWDHPQAEKNDET